jgi:hypothetical protein
VVRPLSRHLLALALAVAGVGAGATGPGYAAGPPVPSAQAALAAAQAGLVAADRAIVDAAARLQEGTARWEAGVEAFGTSQARTVQAEQAAELAVDAAGKSQRLLDDAVASRYRTPELPAALLVLGGGVTGVSEALRATQDLRRVYGRQQASLVDARDLRAAAEVAADAAQRLRDADAVQARALAAELAELQALAERTNQQAQAATALVDRRQAERDVEVAEQLAREQAAESARQARLAADRTAAEQRAAEARRRAAPAAGPGTPATGGPGAGGSCAGSSLAGYTNGRLPVAALCPLRYAPGLVLRADAASAFNRLTEAALAARGTPVCVTDAYRTYASQVELYRTKPSLAAVPGTSNHGWGVAVDLCGGVQDFGTSAYIWMTANAPRYGWVHPAWADPGGSRPEPWHWEYVG